MATAKEKAKPKAKTTKKAKAVKASSVTLHGLSPYVEKKNEEYMNENQREHFKQILKAWRLELMEEVDRTVTHMKDEAANFPCLLYTSPSPRDQRGSRMPSSA